MGRSVLPRPVFAMVIVCITVLAACATDPPLPPPNPLLLSPFRVTAGSTAFTLIVIGEGFDRSMVVCWGDGVQPTTLLSPTMLTAEIPASDVAAPGVVLVSVCDDTSDGPGSNPLPFFIYERSALPQFAYVANHGSDDISAFTIDAASGALSPMVGSSFATGPAPGAVVVHPSGRFAYVPSYGSDALWVYGIDPNTGGLTPLAGSPLSIPGMEYVVLDPSGRFLFALSDIGSSISTYAIDDGSGGLTPVSSFAVEASLSSLAVDATGRFVYAWGPFMGRLSPQDHYQFTINTTTGGLNHTTTRQLTSCWSGHALAPSGRFMTYTWRDLDFGWLRVIHADSISGHMDDLYVQDPSRWEHRFLGWHGTHYVAVHPTRDWVFVTGTVGGAPEPPLSSGSPMLRVMSVEAVSGAMTLVGSEVLPSGFLTVEPTGSFLYVVGPAAEKVWVYSIDVSAGKVSRIPVSEWGTGVDPRKLTFSR